MAGLGLTADAFLPANKEQRIESFGMSPRRLMQTLGTGWGRNLVHPDIWTMVLIGRMERYSACELMLGEPDPLFVVTDVRFDNEAQALRERGGTILRIIRPDAVPVEEHISEVGVSAELIDHTIINDSTLEELDRRVMAFVSGKGLL